MAGIPYELRDSWRGLRRDRLYAAAIVGTLALTLGATTAVFSIVNGVLLRPLPYPQPDALESIREIVPAIAQRYPTLAVTPQHFEVWRHRASSFSSMAQMDWRVATLTGAGDPAQVRMLRTSGTLFDVLRIAPALGRPLSWDDERPDRPRAAVISDGLWRERFSANPQVLGQPVTLAGIRSAVVGVTPPGLALPSLGTLDVSGSMTTNFAAIVPLISLANFDWMGQFNYGVIARLKPGLTLAQAAAEMDVLQEPSPRLPVVKRASRRSCAGGSGRCRTPSSARSGRGCCCCSAPSPACS